MCVLAFIEYWIHQKLFITYYKRNYCRNYSLLVTDCIILRYFILIKLEINLLFFSKYIINNLIDMNIINNSSYYKNIRYLLWPSIKTRWLTNLPGTSNSYDLSYLEIDNGDVGFTYFEFRYRCTIFPSHFVCSLTH